jgi:PAS domain S-box-containing protein
MNSKKPKANNQRWTSDNYRLGLGFALSMALLLFVGNFILNKVEDSLKANLVEELQISLKGNTDLLRLWVDRQKTIGRLMLGEVLVKENILSLLAKAPSTGGHYDQLMRLDELSWLRANLGEVAIQSGFVGFVLFDTSGLQVGAFFDGAVGRKSLMRESDFFLRSLKGEEVLSLPFYGETTFPDADGILRPDQPTMFLSFPIKDHEKIVGVLALRLRPEVEFTRIFEAGRTRKTGEVYAFSKEGQMLSDSRFVDHLRAVGLLAREQAHSILEIDIRNPGGNMVEGYKPKLNRQQWPLTEMAASAVNGESGVNIDGYNDYRGVPVVGTWRWLPESNFAVAYEIDVSEAYRPVLILKFWFRVSFALTVFIYLIFLLEFWRKRSAEQALQASDLHYKMIIDAAFDSIIIIDENGLIQSFYAGAERLFGRSSSEVMGKNVSMLMPSPYQEAHDGYLKAYRETGQAKIIGLGREVVGLRKDGSVFPLDLAVTETEVAGKRFFIGVVRDITERKQSESVAGRLARMLDDSSDEIYSFDATTLKFCQQNRGARDNTGYSDKEFFSLTPYDIKPYSRDEFEAILAPLRRGEKNKLIFETEHIRKNGSRYPVEVHLQLKSNEKPPLFVAIIQDITEHKRVEAEILLAKEAAEQANRAKSIFLANMSHELRTPMNAIMGFSQLLEMDTQHPLVGTQRECLGKVLSASEHLLELINEVLDLSKIESGKLKLHIETIDLIATVDSVFFIAKPMADKHNVSLECRKLPAESYFVEADKLRLKQIVLNLVSNAIKYNKANGSVVISFEKQENNKIRLGIKDSGHGIPKEKVDKLFKPFERFDADSAMIEGTGIGLVIAKQLVEKMGGVIGFDSVFGGGSLFYVDMPLSNKAPLALQTGEGSGPVRAALAATAKRRVLYIEDVPENIYLVKQILSTRPDVDFSAAANALEGIVLAQAKTPDLILMDIHLPVMDGMAAFKRLRAIDATKNIPVIALTADASEVGEKEAMSLGFCAYVTKPIDVKKFLHTIDEFL